MAAGQGRVIRKFSHLDEIEGGARRRSSQGVAAGQGQLEK